LFLKNLIPIYFTKFNKAIKTIYSIKILLLCGKVELR
jgi:hypothetical protein